MKNKIFYFLLFVLVGCASNNDVLMKENESLLVANESRQLFSINTPKGSWYKSASVEKTKNYGFVDIRGVPPYSDIGFAINFELKLIDKWHHSIKEVIPLIKNHDSNAYLNEVKTSFTLKQQKEMGAKNYNGKVISFQGYSCVNTWFEWKVAPLANEGNGVIVFRSFVICPLVIDGELYRFEIGIDSSVRPEFYVKKAEYDRTKRPEDPEININTDELLTTLGDKVLFIFSDIKIYGNVSQNYDDLINKCDPTIGQKCGIYP